MSRPAPVLVIATTNPGKAREIRAGLRDVPLKAVTLADVRVTAPYREKGRTFEENARGKSAFYSRATGSLTLAEDSGLEVAALAGAPGVRSARFSAPGPTDAKNIRKVLRLLKTVPRGERSCRFVCCMAIALRGRVLRTARGSVRGSIVFEPKGSSGFGYDPIFYYRPFGRTFGETPSREKNTVSHRGRALRKIKRFLLAFSTEGLSAAGRKTAPARKIGTVLPAGERTAKGGGLTRQGA